MSQRHLIIGGGKQGKSPFLADLVRKTLVANNAARFIVITPAVPKAWEWAPSCSDLPTLERFAKFGTGVIVFIARDEDRMNEVLQFLADIDLRDCNVILEDGTQQMFGRASQPVRFWIYQAKNQGGWVFIVTHLLTYTPLELRMCVNRITLFYTAEDIEKNLAFFRSKFPVPYFDTLKKFNKKIMDAHRGPNGQLIPRPFPDRWIQDHYTFDTGL